MYNLPMLDDIGGGLLSENLFPDGCKIASLTVRSNAKGRFIEIVPSKELPASEKQRLFDVCQADETVDDIRGESGLYTSSVGEKQYEVTKVISDGQPIKLLGALLVNGFITEPEMMSVYERVKKADQADLSGDKAKTITSRLIDGIVKAKHSNAPATESGAHRG